MKRIVNIGTAILFLYVMIGSAGEKPQKPHTALAKVTGVPVYGMLNIGNVAAFYEANGEQERNPSSGNSGLYYPRRTTTAIYSAGIIWGGLFKDGMSPSLRVNGQIYQNGTKPGTILGVRTGIAEDPNNADVRIWRIRRDYATADLTADAADFSYSGIAGYPDRGSLYYQYRQDWLEWPVAKGAPFYDADSDGAYTPKFYANGTPILYPDADEPGIANADQVIWFACNDIGVSQPWQCAESGIEEQVTIYGYNGYNRNDALGNVIYKRFRIIYKGTATTPDTAHIDSMYLAQWSDADIGDRGDDFAGCDTVLNMIYAYNGRPYDSEYDKFLLAPPAAGYSLLQGPLVKGVAGQDLNKNGVDDATDFATWDLRKIGPGYVNLPMTAAFLQTYGTEVPPPFTYTGAIQWYQMLRGLQGSPIGPPDPPMPIDPITGKPSPFMLSGDPVTRTGWYDGIIDAPGDRLGFLSSGPFTLAVGDTQEIVLAFVGGLGGSYISNVAAMKQEAQDARTVFNSGFAAYAPALRAHVTHPNISQATIALVADGRQAEADSITVKLKGRSDSLYSMILLFDDGLHGDGASGDRIFGNIVTLPVAPYPLKVSATIFDRKGRTLVWSYPSITTIGTMELRSFRIFSDNINNDGKANPGENLRYGFTLQYTGASALGNVLVIPSVEPDQKEHQYPHVASGMTDSMTYNPVNPQSYFSVGIPTTFSDSIYPLPVCITDTSGNEWVDTARIKIEQWPVPPQTAAINHSQGGARGAFQVSVVDPLVLKDHLYAIYGRNNPDGTLKFTLRDSTAGTTMLQDHLIPDSLGHSVPVTDGFKVLRGSIQMTWGWRDYTVPQGTLRWTAAGATGMGLEGFAGTMGKAYGKWSSSSKVLPQQLRDVLFQFAAIDSSGRLIDTNDVHASYGYRYLRNASLAHAKPEFAPFIVRPDTGYAYQDYQKRVPFAAYDMDHVPPRRLMVGFLENNVAKGLVDGKYWPKFGLANNTSLSGPMEWFFIFDVPYSETPDPALMKDIQHDTLPIMWWGTPCLIPNQIFQADDQFEILADFPYTSQDIWTFNPTVVLGVKAKAQLPPAFALLQNYPNPFNPSSTISYELPTSSMVTLKIYNILGQEVKTLVDECQSPGEHRVIWLGKNNHGQTVSSGVYLYRISAGRFSQTKKLLLLR